MIESFSLAVAETSLSQWILVTYWLWPVLEIIHFVGLSLLLGGLIIIDLRMAGHFRSLNLSATHQLLPMVFIGFALNLITGVLFFIGDPMRYSINIGFQIKMILIMIAGLNALLYYWKINPHIHSWDPAANPPALAKTVAYVSLITWTGVLLCGRLIPYVGTG
jgi:hypothetical protein